MQPRERYDIILQMLAHQDLVTGSEVFAEAIHDRMSRMYESFKNNTSIVIWSLGNESDWGSNLRREMLWFKQVDSRPVHYCEVWRESTWKSLSEAEQREVRKNIDIVSVMYPTEELLERYLAFIGNTHALVLAEYSHAMGNSCGDLRFFDDKMEKNLGFAGGFIWEWADHGLRLRDENGKTYFGYGGDFGDVHNMSNVCVDGTVSSDRHPHSSLREAKAVFAPIRITRAENNFEIRNRYSFRNLSALNIHWEKQEEGQITQTGTFSVEVEPGETAVVSSPIGMSAHKADGVLTFRVMDGDREVTAFSFALESPVRQLPTVGHPALFETKSEYIVKAGDVVYRFRKDRGTLTAMSVSGREMLDAPLWWNPYRPFTDNECSPIGDIRMRSCYALTQNRAFGNTEYGEMRVRPFKARQTAEEITISGEFVFAVQGREYLTRGHIDYHINPRGHVTIHQKGIFNPKLPVWLPRYGFCLPLRDNDVKVRYFGLGPKECYEDKSVHAILGRYDYLPDDPEDAYEKPQEFGSRFGVRWVDVENEDMILHVDTDAMAFTVSHLDIHQIGKAAHAKDLISTDKTFLFCDYRMSGVGSNSCGGEPPKEEYRINPGEEYDFCVTLAPEKKEA